MKNKHLGSSLDEFLKEEQIENEVAAKVAKRTFVHQLNKHIKKLHKNKNSFRKEFYSPTTTERIFDDHVGISLQTLAKTAGVVDCDLELNLVPRRKARRRFPMFPLISRVISRHFSAFSWTNFGLGETEPIISITCASNSASTTRYLKP